jgi:hypothetical protein
MRNKLIVINLAAIAIGGLLSGCATKGPKKVYAMPAPVPERIVAPKNQAVADAPRTKPGKIMDPDSVTYAQVPSRIIYLPGQHGIFARSSAKQEVSYNLVPVDRIGAIQAEATPEFGETIVRQETSIEIKDVVETSFMNDDGSTSKGVARRLGVLGNNDVEKKRAENLTKRGEELRWSAEMGWVGFTPEKKAKPYKPAKQKEEKIPDLDIPEPSSKKKKAEIEPIKERNPMDIISKDEKASEEALDAEKEILDEKVEVEEEIDLTIE